MKTWIANKCFASKLDLARHFSELLDRYGIGDPILEPDADDLRWLLCQHPDYEQKCGAGISGFTVIDSIMGSRCFAVRRVDGSVTDFSYRVCLNGRPSILSRWFSALRHEVADDIQAAKMHYFTRHADENGCIPCAVTGAPITIDRADADHAPPFSFYVLSRTFTKARKIIPHENLLEPRNNYQQQLRDRSLAREWREYHHELAHLRLIDPTENSRRIGEAMPRATDRQLILEKNQ